MSTDPLSQTSFSSQIPTAPGPNSPPVLQPVKKNQFISLAIGILVVLAVSVVIFVLIVRQRGQTTLIVTPTPLASQAPVETDQIRKDIEPDLQNIENSNPEADEHPFPPVDFTIRIKDPASR